jgi:beta-lactamase regulating signal transducer with metallopeptidase domain
MIQFAYSFCMAMLHSLWQAALLALLYFIADRLTHKNNAPLANRNFLYIAIGAQLVLSACTFLIYFSGTSGFGTLAGTIDNISASLLGGDNIKTITPLIFSVYLFIILGKLLKAVYNWYSFKVQFKTGLQKPAVELKLFTELKAQQFGIKRKVKLWFSNSVATPVTFGYFKPIILLPVALLNNISTLQAETLILHELTHIRTHDYLLNWFLVAAETIFFFNPFIAGLCKKIKLEREKNCDVNVLSFGYSPAIYAETLLQAERMKQLTPVFQLAAVSRKKHLLQRIQFFTNEKVINQPLRFNIVAPLVGLVLLFMLCTAVLFQSQNGTQQLQSDGGKHFLPAYNYIVSNTEFSSPVFSRNIATEPVVIIPEKALQIPTPEQKKIITPAAPVEPEPQTVEETPAAIDLNYARPATTTENDAARRIVIKEEGSGTASVKVYYLTFVNGKWVLQPEWVLTAKEIMLDSLPGKIDSLQRRLRKIYPDQQ